MATHSNQQAQLYTHFASVLIRLLGPSRSVRLLGDGHLPLYVEHQGLSPDRLCHLISVAHIETSGCQAFYDPEMVFELSLSSRIAYARPLSYRNDCLGLNQQVHSYDSAGRKVTTNRALSLELDDFARTWFLNIEYQGYLDDSAHVN